MAIRNTALSKWHRLQRHIGYRKSPARRVKGFTRTLNSGLADNAQLGKGKPGAAGWVMPGRQLRYIPDNLRAIRLVGSDFHVVTNRSTYPPFFRCSDDGLELLILQALHYVHHRAAIKIGYHIRTIGA